MTSAQLASPAEILAFWRAAGFERWFSRNDAFNSNIRARFLPTYEAAAAGHLDDWLDSDEGALALVIVLDQFPRNLFRGTPRAFATDAAALRISEAARARGIDKRTDAELRPFFYLPLMHSEDPGHQQQCVAIYEALNAEGAGNEAGVKSAREHADIIHRFGRFPHRNVILGRDTTKDEQAFLDSGGFSG